jgi:hypothetical protein
MTLNMSKSKLSHFGAVSLFELRHNLVSTKLISEETNIDHVLARSIDAVRATSKKFRLGRMRLPLKCLLALAFAMTVSCIYPAL